MTPDDLIDFTPELRAEAGAISQMPPTWVGRSPPYDKDTGVYLGSVRLPAVPAGNPMTYLHEGKQTRSLCEPSPGTRAPAHSVNANSDSPLGLRRGQ